VTKLTGEYVQYGAGFDEAPGWINFDASPTLRIERLPIIGRRLAKLAGNAQPFPDGIIYGDVTRGLPVQSGSVAGLYASHVLEHLSLEDLRASLKVSFDILKSGGIFRLIVPDLLQRARDYVEAAERDDREASMRFMTGTMLGQEQRPRGMLGRLRHVLGNSAHLWMWDELSMQAELERAGFVDVRRAELGDSGDAMFDRVERLDRFVDGSYREVAIQARKP
jgi:hypothetical protein